MLFVQFLVKKERIQKPIYYTSKVLKDVETRYTKPEKLVYALTIIVWCLCPYFQAHPVTVLTDQPLRMILQKVEMLGHTTK